MNYWTEDRKKILFWIANDLDLPVFADAYLGAVICFEEKTPGYVTFVCHTCRDIMNIMAGIVSVNKGDRVDYLKLVDKVQNKWMPEWNKKNVLSSDLDPTDTQANVNVTRDFCSSVEELIDEHKGGKRRAENKGTDFFQTFLEYKDKDNISVNKIKLWKKARIWFIRNAHLRKKPFDGSIYSDLEKHFSYMELTLLTAADSVRNRLKAIDEILAETN